MGILDKLSKPIVDAAKIFSYVPDIRRNLSVGENIFGFYSPSGGTGVTTLVANIATALGATGKSVAVIDCNLNHPQLYRYLTKDRMPPSLSLTDRWINTAAPIMEYAAYSEDSMIATFSTTMSENIADLSQFSDEVISKCYREIAMLFDFVLIDMHGGLNDEPVFSALSVCSKIITLVRPIDGDIESVYKDEMTVLRYNFGTRFTNLVQCLVRDFAYRAKDLKEDTDLDFTILANIPYCPFVERVGANYDVFVKSKLGTDDASQQYRDAVKHLAEVILNYEDT
ncbi:MAG: division plane positioning ATPase MipZ [Clostridia bacterium]